MQALQTIIAAATETKRQEGVQTHSNREGAPAYRRSLREQVVQVLVTGTLGNTFYASGQQLAAEAMEVLLTARQECPEFLARALVYARSQGLMKALPVLGLVILSGGRKNRSLFESVFDQVVRTPDDLRAFTALCHSGTIPGRGGLGGMAAKAVRMWLPGISEYHAVKYGSASSREMPLRKILRMIHPKPTSAAVEERFGWLAKGSSALGSNQELNPQIQALEALKTAATEEQQLALIRGGKLPFEVVVPSLKATTPAIWGELLRQAPYMNLLRNLVTFTRHEVFVNEENVRYAVERLTCQEAVTRSKVLPFRFFDAWRAYTQGQNPDSRIADAIRTALEMSFVNMPTLGSRTVAIGTDVSGSMHGLISHKSSTRFVDIAGVFTGALLKATEDRVIPLPFDDVVHPDCGLSARDDIITTAERISCVGGGGTAVGAPVQHLLDRKIQADVFIGITDNEEWAYGEGYTCRSNFLSLWRSYRRDVNPDAQAYLVTIAPYRDAVAPTGEKGVHFIYGWSDHVLRYITLSLEGGDSQLQEIECMSLEAVENPNEGTGDENTEPDR